MNPAYDIDKIKFATDPATFQKAVDLYENRKVTQFKEDIGDCSAIVIGTKPYRVSVEARYFDYGSCECYLGQNDMLCKHMVAVAIYAVTNGQPLTKENKQVINTPTCSGRLGALSNEELVNTKKSITSAMRYIKSYTGPSRIWFDYQNSLSEGCARLSKLVSELPVSEQTAKLLVAMLLQLDNKLGDGIDDSDGTVGSFIAETVLMLKQYAKLDPICIKAFKKLSNQSTCFGWEELLVRIFDKEIISD